MEPQNPRGNVTDQKPFTYPGFRSVPLVALEVPVKLVVQVPCLNEEETLPSVLESIPKEIPGIDEIVILIVDDGCTDRTVEARC